MTSADDGGFSGRTLWATISDTPMRAFLRTESGSAVVLLVAAVAALVWVNVDQASYDALWGTDLSVRVGRWAVSMDLRRWVNDGLMALFFFVVGLEARREVDLGELRERRRLALPLLAGLGGMLVPVLLFLAFNAGHSSAHGWGAAMSTDTAFALGMLALVGPRCPRTVARVPAHGGRCRRHRRVAGHHAGLQRSRRRAFSPLIAFALFAVVLSCARCTSDCGLPYVAARHCGLGRHARARGIDPLVVGLAMGLLTYAYPPRTSDLERATELFRLFREQPTPELARSARAGVDAALSPNDRLQQLLAPVDAAT